MSGNRENDSRSEDETDIRSILKSDVISAESLICPGTGNMTADRGMRRIAVQS